VASVSEAGASKPSASSCAAVAGFAALPDPGAASRDAEAPAMHSMAFRHELQTVCTPLHRITRQAAAWWPGPKPSQGSLLVLGKWGPFLIPFPVGQPQSNCKAEPNQSQRHQRLVKQSPNSWPNSWLLSIHCTNMVRLSRTVTCWQAASMITYAAAAGPRIPPGACRGCCTSASTWTASTARWQRSRGARPAHQRRRQHLHTRRRHYMTPDVIADVKLYRNQQSVAQL
jgi:hypothetical protein